MDWLADNLWQTWLGVAIVLGVAEMFSLDLVLIMVAAGAVAGMIVALVGAPFAIQALVAAGASVAMLALVRPQLARRFHGGPELSLGHGKLVGQRAVVTETITGLDVGRIRLAGEIWSAAPYDEHLTITPGQTVEVLAIKGATAYVHPVATLDS
ncbi:membrane protein [Nocardioides szechwanensis]|uniref:Membrane protein implicated in regulation of membrane protease activity n=1 Tax=Nocardioides szechwanensis TaxID=1005944 RepID=A0A1G9WYV6_9ACTN|nr:NfeD family protein [Nocardioides szechwanensis]GEP32480.1 membrane protein [Nocardioides szechwanensis]SDM89744.1 Membrane protein implicated in regulation of membrane protease activity [Nocardioides szechwanensis]